MSKRGLFFILPFTLLALPLAAEEPAAEETLPVRPTEAHARMLVANRSLLTQFEQEYAKLKKQERENPSVFTERKLVGAQVKIEALKADTGRLHSELAQKADEFLKDILNRRESPAQPPSVELPPLAPLQNLSVPEMHELALTLVADKKLREAIKIYEEIVLQSPDDDQAYLIMGHNYILLHEYESAEMAFHNAVNIDRANIDEITPFYENLALQDPNDDESRSNLGYAYVIVGQLNKAAEAFKDALDANPSNEEAARGLWMLTQKPSRQ